MEIGCNEDEHTFFFSFSIWFAASRRRISSWMHCVLVSQCFVLTQSRKRCVASMFDIFWMYSLHEKSYSLLSLYSLCHSLYCVLPLFVLQSLLLWLLMLYKLYQLLVNIWLIAIRVNKKKRITWYFEMRIAIVDGIAFEIVGFCWCTTLIIICHGWAIVREFYIWSGWCWS